MLNANPSAAFLLMKSAGRLAVDERHGTRAA